MKVKIEFPKNFPTQGKLEFEIPPEILEAIKRKLPFQISFGKDEKKEEPKNDRN